MGPKNFSPRLAEWRRRLQWWQRTAEASERERVDAPLVSRGKRVQEGERRRAPPPPLKRWKFPEAYSFFLLIFFDAVFLAYRAPVFRSLRARASFLHPFVHASCNQPPFVDSFRFEQGRARSLGWLAAPQRIRNANRPAEIAAPPHTYAGPSLRGELRGCFNGSEFIYLQRAAARYLFVRVISIPRL